MYKKVIRTTIVVIAAFVAVLNGCASKEKEEESTIVPSIATLDRADDCKDLLSKIQDDVTAKIDLYAQYLRFPDKYSYSDTGGIIPNPNGADGGTAIDSRTNETGTAPSGGVGGMGGAGGVAGSGGGSPAYEGTGGTGGSSSADNNGGSNVEGGDNKSSAPSAYSKTTTQVEGVDEPDIVRPTAITFTSCTAAN